MELIKSIKEIGQAVTNFNSVSAIYSKIMKTVESTNIGLMYIEKGGKLGYHEAPVPQLFILVQGEGWIEGEDKKRIMLKSGEGVFWENGEGHSSGSDTGLTALVIQSEKIEFPLG
ncbi:MAG TPA: cupin [Bacillales bacterium]|nr:cupin [Bacillales bacterium]